MSNTAQNVWIGIVLAVNFIGAAMLTSFAWLSSIWMTGKWAWNWTAHDWASEAFHRAVYWIIVAAVVAAIAAVVNRLILGWACPQRRFLPWIVGGVDGLVIVLGGIAGSIQFFIEKPYM